MEMILGLLTGIIFGFILQKAEVLRFERQVGFLLLRDMTIIKFMFSAIIVGVVGIYLLRDLGIVELKIKGTLLAAQIIGGLLFGVGWAIGGYCPGTSVGALGEGRVHALWVIVGMLAGAALYAETYPRIKETLLSYGNLGELTLPDILPLPHWMVIGFFAAAVFVLLIRLNRYQDP